MVGADIRIAEQLPACGLGGFGLTSAALAQKSCPGDGDLRAISLWLISDWLDEAGWSAMGKDGVMSISDELFVAKAMDVRWARRYSWFAQSALPFGSFPLSALAQEVRRRGQI